MSLAVSLPLTTSPLLAAERLPVGFQKKVPFAQTQNLLRSSAGRGVVPADSQGRVRAIVQFVEKPTVLMRRGADLRSAEARDYGEQLARLRAARLEQIERLGGRVQSVLSNVLNAAVVEVAQERIPQIRRLAGVKSVRPARVYRPDQSPPGSVGELIGTTALQQAGITGEGVVIAVVDSGVDYTHAALGGTGTVAAYQAAVSGSAPLAVGDSPDFPNAKVIGGFDYLGETWTGNSADPGGLAVTPDPDPVDNKQTDTDFAGHGTAVSSASAGLPLPQSGLAGGTAPGAKVLAYRGCSRISASCEGSALLNSIEAAVAFDVSGAFPGYPNPVRKVINLSLGAAFFDPSVDDLSEAVRNAVEAGVVVVASAGNSGDLPYATGTPGSTETVIGVAASLPPLNIGPGLEVPTLGVTYQLGVAQFGPALTEPLTTTFKLAGSAEINLACSNPPNQNPPAPAEPPIADLSGSTGIADRGDCEFSEKVYNLQQAGALAGLIVNNAPGVLTMAPGAAASLVTIPSFIIDQEQGTTLKAALAGDPGLTATFIPQLSIPNPNFDQIADFSSRGPSPALNRIKPDITAPTNTFEANIGTGNLGAEFGGTSNSAPVTSGVAALVLSKYPAYTPNQVKTALMNSANPQVFADKAAGTVVPIARQGAGRVQADRAANLQTLAFDAADPARPASLSLGYRVFPKSETLTRTVAVQNLSGSAKTYTLSVQPRYPEDAGKGVSFQVPDTLSVPAGQTRTFAVTVNVRSDLLPAGGLDAGLGGNDTAAFSAFEQDGYITIDGGADNTVSLPYLLLPRKGSEVQASSQAGPKAVLVNAGVAATTAQVFNLAGSDPQDLPGPEAGENAINTDIKEVGLRFLPATGDTAETIEFAVSLYRPFTNPRNAPVQIDVDVTGDGIADYFVFNYDLELLTGATTGQNVTYILEAATGLLIADFYTQLNYNAGQLVLPVLAASIGATAETRLQLRAVTGSTALGFFGQTDLAPDSGLYAFTPAKRVTAAAATSVAVPALGTASVDFTVERTNAGASPSDAGLLFVLPDNPLASQTDSLRIAR
ncbi:S8 family serine peptidase [Gloeobacter violaceus]|uniref:Glr3087 protein n=1 Tax=Gloeobacter violaceus (strain ATCC 29082 / PCC 7421) TaxID=251221 RepID=Q7NC92_GLOVI|nr:S8 family serine peptidase [Gloeobacter violaceus]BAC91028.1 glr3087 [Gloeobacter violaceus PCC 7421]